MVMMIMTMVMVMRTMLMLARLRWVGADLNAGSKIVTESQAFLYPRYSHT